MKKNLFAVLAVLAAALVAACGPMPNRTDEAAPVSSAPAFRPGYGTVESVSVIATTGGPRTGGTSGLGAAGGAVVGAIIGSQFGSGLGRAAATVGGAAGGAYVGNRVEGNRDERAAAPDAYRLTLRMDDGTLQQITQDNRAFQVGDRVQITTDGRVIRL